MTLAVYPPNILTGASSFDILSALLYIPIVLTTPITSELRNRVRELRTVRGLSQQDLASRAGLTRQTVSAVENHRYAPGTAAAFRLARVLNATVDELFTLAEEGGEQTVELAGPTTQVGGRVALANVRGRTVAHRLSGVFAIHEGFASADGMLPEGRDSTLASLLVSRDQLEKSALVMGCDPSLGILSAHIARRGPDTRLVWLPASSRGALRAVARGEAHLAGTHLLDRDGNASNVGDARNALRETGGLVVAFATWEQGLVVAAGNPLDLRTVADLKEKNARLINREPGAGCRELLDSLLAREGIEPAALAGYDRIASGHLAVARMVAIGGADAGIALRAAAQVLGLGFVPLTSVRFDLAVPRDLLATAPVARVMEILQSRDFRREIDAIAGYEVSEMGRVVAEVAPAA